MFLLGYISKLLSKQKGRKNRERSDRRREFKNRERKSLKEGEKKEEKRRKGKIERARRRLRVGEIEKQQEQEEITFSLSYLAEQGFTKTLKRF